MHWISGREICASFEIPWERFNELELHIFFFVVVDSNYRFVYIDVGAYGKDCDSSVFQRTNFYRMLTDGRLDVPQPALIQEGSDVNLPFGLVGDQAFSLTDKVLRPYKGYFLSDTKKYSTIDFVGRFRHSQQQMENIS